MVDVTPLSGIAEPVFEPRQMSEDGLMPESEGAIEPGDVAAFELRGPIVPPSPGRLGFEGAGMAVGYDEAATDLGAPGLASKTWEGPRPNLNSLATLRPLGQLRDSFILATNEEGLWIVDQHVAHERVLFEKILRERKVEQVQRQRLLMPVLVDLLPEQMVTFASIAEELERNGFEAEPFGPRTLAVKATPVGLEGKELERMLEEVLGVTEKSAQVDNEETRRTRIAASIACHAAIKVNMKLEPEKIDWLLRELGKTEHPTSCPHGRPIALRYSLRDIQRAFQRI
jgi:DNA mismatch repair protein MutL